MLRIFTPEPLGPGLQSGPSDTLSAFESPDDFEIVLGRRQVASLSFVGVVALALCSGASYLAGKASAAGTASAVATSDAPKPVQPAAQAAVLQGDAHQENVVNVAAGSDAIGWAKGLVADASIPPGQSIFGEPEKGAFYIQVGATDRAPAMILTSGLRTHGFPTLAAPGSTPSTFRVLVGPYKTVQEFQAAKEAVGSLGLAPFVRAPGE